MTAYAEKPNVSAFSIALPAMLLAALLSGFAVWSGTLGRPQTPGGLEPPQTVVIEPRTIRYRAGGEFLRDNRPVDGPMLNVAMTAPLEILKYQVSVADYARCVNDGVCKATDRQATALGNLPATGVNYDDALAYAGWLSDKTGAIWRLPTDEQWAFAAGTRFFDDALGFDPESRNPAERWLADYAREAERTAARSPAPQPAGAFGENEYGVADLAGNVWEWTQTCHRRATLDRAGQIAGENPACGVYVTEGKHRAPMSSFIRDPKSGGCSVGTPPDNLGFRLIRDRRWYASLIRLVEKARG